MNDYLRFLLIKHFGIENRFDSTFLNCNDINFLFNEYEKHIQNTLQVREREFNSQLDESVASGQKSVDN